MTSVDKAYKKLKSFIINYKLTPGQKILPDELSNLLDMSRTPVVHALNKLEQEGYAILRPNKGYFVAEVSIDEAKELFDVREAIEMKAISLAVRNGSQENLKALEEKLIAHREHGGLKADRKRLLLDADFHLGIANMGGNKTLLKYLSQVFEYLYLRFKIEGIDPQRTLATPKEHEEIFLAIKEGNLALGKRNLKNHLIKSKFYILKAIERSEEELNPQFI